MKNNLIYAIVISFIFIFLFWRVESRKPYIEPSLQKHIDLFKDYCDILNVDCKRLKILDSVKFKKDLTELGLFDLRRFPTFVIDIRESLKDDSLATKIIMFHELFHCMGVMHENNDYKSLMSDSLDIEEYKSYYSDDIMFSIEVIRNFAKIKYEHTKTR